MGINRVLLVLRLGDALVLKVIRTLSRWTRGDLIKDQAVLAKHILIGHRWVESRAILDYASATLLGRNDHASAAVNIDKLWLVVSELAIGWQHPHVRVALGHLGRLGLATHLLWSVLNVHRLLSLLLL